MSTHIRTIAVALLFLASLTLAEQSRAQTSGSPTTFLEDSLVGKDSFEAYCAPCHGSTGAGDGPIAGSLKRKPADLTRLAASHGNRFPLGQVTAIVMGEGRTVAAHGPTEMPIWGPLFRAFESDARVRVRVNNVVAHIETLQRPATAQETGARLFRTYCASCHGADGRGAGPAAAAMRSEPPNLTTFAKRNGGVFPSERLRQIIDGRGIASHGDRDMPVWGNAFKRTAGAVTENDVAARIKAITDYIEGLQERAVE